VERADKIWYPIESPVIGGRKNQDVMGSQRRAVLHSNSGGRVGQVKKKFVCRMVESLIMRGIRKSSRWRTGRIRVDAGDPTFMVVIRRRAHYLLGQRWGVGQFA